MIQLKLVSLRILGNTISSLNYMIKEKVEELGAYTAENGDPKKHNTLE